MSLKVLKIEKLKKFLKNLEINLKLIKNFNQKLNKLENIYRKH